MSKETRNRAKAVNFGIVYGISPFGLAANLNIPQAEAKLYIETYFARYVGVRQFIDRVLEETRATQQVRTLFGRVRPIPDIQSRNANLRGFAERTAVNTPLQGTAADMIKIAMIRIADQLREQKLRDADDAAGARRAAVRCARSRGGRSAHTGEAGDGKGGDLKVPVVADVGVGHNWRDLL